MGQKRYTAEQIIGKLRETNPTPPNSDLGPGL